MTLLSKQSVLSALTTITAALLMVTMVAPNAQANPAQVEQADIVNDNPANYTPHVLDGEINTLVQIGNTIYAGGGFSQVRRPGGPIVNRSNLFAFNADTGAIVAGFAPTFDGSVEALIPAPDGNSVYVAGYFRNVNGSARRSLTRLQTSNGSFTPGFTTPSFNSSARDLRLVGDQLLVGGTFSYVGGSQRVGLVSLDAATGSPTDYLPLDLATTRDGTVRASKLDITPDGSAMYVIGNFTEIDGQPRSQMAKVDLSPAGATVSSWTTDFYTSVCASVFDTYMRDLDISPDGTYLIVTTTGAYRAPPSSCDTWARFEIGGSDPGATPTWVNYTGGDTTYAVEVTGTAVYLGGHFRWANNPYAGDRIGPGAVPREGLAAVDPRSGMPFEWNPTRYRGVGVFDILATDKGLWIGHDTEVVANETHPGLAFFPLAGGTTPPPEEVGSVPSDVYLTGLSARGAPDPSVLYRVNAGGSGQLSVDDGPDWAAGNGSEYVNTGNNATWSPVSDLDPSVPNSDSDRAPRALFDSERWDGGGNPEMQYSFPVPADTPLDVRLYFANRYAGTSEPGERVFDVSIENDLKLDNFDIAATYGDQIGGMQEFAVTSTDGSLEIDFGHVTENPLINGIEIIDPSLAGTPPDPSVRNVVRRQFFNGTDAPTNPGQINGPEAWSSARGSMLIDDVVYTGWSDGTFSRRTFDGDSFGTASDIYLYNGSFVSEVSGVSGMFYDKADGRMYYTIRGDSQLYWRGFSPESDVVGPTAYPAAGDVAELDAANVEGMFRSGDQLYFADSNTGALWSVGFQDGAVIGPKQLVDETIDWRSRGAWVWNDDPAPGANEYPVAVAEVDCSDLSCDFDSSNSYDTGGSIVSTTWDFGDGQTSDQANPTHEYPRAGEFTATLTVTDDDGVTATSAVAVTVDELPNVAPVAGFNFACAELVCDFTSTSTDSDGVLTDWAWDFGGDGTDSGATVQHEFAGEGDYTVVLTVTDDEGATASDQQLVSVSQANVAPVAGFNFACAELVCDFTSTSTDSDGVLTDWAWDFGGDGTDSGATVQHEFGSEGDYTVVLTVTDDEGATASDQQLVSVSQANVAPVAGFNFACAELVCDFTSTSTDSDGVLTDWAWDFGGDGTDSGATVQHEFAGEGDYTVVLTVTDDEGATASDQQLVSVSQANVAPVAGFNFACAELVCDFTSTSTDSDGVLTDWAWDFGGDGTDSGATVQHEFAGEGDYTVVLTVTDDEGATASDQQLVSVSQANVAPVAGFNFACAELVCDFTSTSTDSDGVLTDWAWDFGGDGTDSGATVQHEFAGEGDYTVVLTVTDDEGATASDQQLVSVSQANVAPVAGFNFACAELVCDFTSTSTDSDGVLTDWAWDFGGDGTDSGATVQHEFAGEGDFQVTLTVTDDEGATASDQQLVSVSQANVAPVAGFNFACAELVCDFTSTSTDSDGVLTDWAWDFGGDGTDSGATVQHEFAGEGDYTVVLTVTDDEGATASDQQLVSVSQANVAPVAGFNFACAELVCDFTSTSTDSDGVLTDWAWDFGGDGTDSGATVQHEFAGEGDYTVVLTVTDDEGATDSVQQQVVVSVAPVSDVAFRDSAVFGGNVNSASVGVPNSVQAGDSMLLFASTNTGEAPVDTPAGWTSVGQTLDGTILTILYSRVAQAGDAGGQVSFDFPVYSKTDLTLLVYSGTDATDPIAGWAGVPEPAVTAEHSTPALEVGSDTSWVVSYWIVKSGQVSDWSLPTGQVQRSLQAGGGGGRLTSVAADTDGPAGQGTWPGATATADAAAGRATMWTIELRAGSSEPVPNVDPVAEFSFTCELLVCSFDGSGSTDSDGTVEGYVWDFGGEGSAAVVSPDFTFSDAGEYTVSLTVTDDEGATGSVDRQVVVSSEPPPNVDPVADFSFTCDGLACDFDGSGSDDSDGSITDYAWDFGGEGSAAVVSPDFTFPDAGTYAVVLTVTDDEGATDSVQQQVVVSVAPVSDVAFRDSAVFGGNVNSASVGVPNSVQAGDSMLLFASTNTGEAPVDTPAGWTSVGQTLDGTILTILYSRVAQAGDAGGQVSFDFPVYSKTDLTLLVYSGTDATDPIAGWAGVPEPAVTAEHSTPALEVGSDTSWVVSYWIVKSGQVSDWSLPTGQVQRSLQAGGGGGRLTSVAADTDGPAGQGTWPGATATADAAAGRATMWTIELRAG